MEHLFINYGIGPFIANNESLADVDSCKKIFKI